MSTAGGSDPKRDLEIYAILRAYARDESELVNQRLNWLGVSQSVLLTGFAALITAVSSNNIGRVARGLSANAFGWHVEGAWVLYAMFGAIAVTGAMLCIITFANVGGAYRSSDTISTKWREYLRLHADEGLSAHLPYMEFGFDRLGARGAPAWRLGVILIPTIFCAVWVVLGTFAEMLVHTGVTQ